MKADVTAIIAPNDCTRNHTPPNLNRMKILLLMHGRIGINNTELAMTTTRTGQQSTLFLKGFLDFCSLTFVHKFLTK